jgi:hypothetical protein
MSFTFPDFPEPTPIDAQRSWTATVDSYDQRNDEAYYLVTLQETGREAGRFMVQVGLYWAGDDWTGPGFLPRLRDEIHRVAATRKTNTSYTGAMLPGPHRA